MNFSSQLQNALNSKSMHFCLDLSVWSLVVSNVAVIAWSLLEKWPLAAIVSAYWCQSVSIGIFWSVKVLTSENFYTKSTIFTKGLGVDIIHSASGLRHRKLTIAKRLQLAHFFFISYGLVHLIFGLVLWFSSQTTSPRVIVYAGSIFFFNQFFSFIYNSRGRGEQKQNIDKVFILPYVRIAPMIVIFLISPLWGIAISSKLAITIFGSVKTLADVIMYVLAKTKEGQKQALWLLETSKVKCRCSEIDRLDGRYAYEYAKRHLKELNRAEKGQADWVTKYACPNTGKRWIKIDDYTKPIGSQIR